MLKYQAIASKLKAVVEDYKLRLDHQSKELADLRTATSKPTESQEADMLVSIDDDEWAYFGASGDQPARWVRSDELAAAQVTNSPNLSQDAFKKLVGERILCNSCV